MEKAGQPGVTRSIGSTAKTRKEKNIDPHREIGLANSGEHQCRRSRLVL